MNPLVPTGVDVLLASAVVLHTVLVLAALVALALSADKRRWPSTVLLVALFPFAGPVIALIALRRRRHHPLAEIARTAPHPT
ncbi:hypothetical protein [Microbacterium sp.]|uniref:hypothetical protein n=1 Tax=Microbacterium sp. TaxID=51671 RepID=UPI003A8980E4